MVYYKRTMHRTPADRTSEREMVVTRLFKAPTPRVFEAWTVPALMTQWWTPQSFGMSFLSCEIDARPGSNSGGTYRFVFSHPSSKEPMTFFGRYIEVIPNARLVWTNEEGGGAGVVTTATFEARGDETLFTMHDLHPSKEALDEAIASGSTDGFNEMFDQLDALLARRP